MKRKVVGLLLFILAIIEFGNVKTKAYTDIEARAYTNYDSVIYITNNPDYYDNVVDIYNYTSYGFSDVDVWYFPTINSLKLIDYCYYNTLYFVDNSCFIFECNYDFDLKSYNLNNYSNVQFDYFSIILEDMFSTLKMNNNDVIFICNTDQIDIMTTLIFYNM